MQKRPDTGALPYTIKEEKKSLNRIKSRREVITFGSSEVKGDDKLSVKKRRGLVSQSQKDNNEKIQAVTVFDKLNKTSTKRQFLWIARRLPVLVHLFWAINNVPLSVFRSRMLSSPDSVVNSVAGQVVWVSNLVGSETLIPYIASWNSLIRDVLFADNVEDVDMAYGTVRAINKSIDITINGTCDHFDILDRHYNEAWRPLSLYNVSFHDDWTVWIWNVICWEYTDNKWLVCRYEVRHDIWEEGFIDESSNVLSEVYSERYDNWYVEIQYVNLSREKWAAIFGEAIIETKIMSLAERSRFKSINDAYNYSGQDIKHSFSFCQEEDWMITDFCMKWSHLDKWDLQFIRQDSWVWRVVVRNNRDIIEEFDIDNPNSYLSESGYFFPGL